VVVADVADYDAVRPAFDGQDAVVHLAAAPKPDDPWGEAYRSNIRGTQNVLAAARNASVGSAMFASSHRVMGRYEGEHAPELYEPDYALTLTHTDPVRPALTSSTASAGTARGVSTSGTRRTCSDTTHSTTPGSGNSQRPPNGGQSPSHERCV